MQSPHIPVLLDEVLVSFESLTTGTFVDMTLGYGGHSQAAGLSISVKNVEELARRFDEYVRRNLRDEDFQPILNVDAIINPAQIDLN